MKIYQQLHTLSARKRNFLLGVTFVVLTIPSYIAVLVLNLVPLSENVQSFLTIVCLIGGVVFASYDTYRIYKMVPLKRWCRPGPECGAERDNRAAKGPPAVKGHFDKNEPIRAICES